MYFECDECQVILHGESPPLVCPSCGLAGVLYSPVDEATVSTHLAEGERTIELGFIPDDSPGWSPSVRSGR